jgi:anaerobic magnesium-protoporphyrin IX monomethyl ester cyclase
MSDNDSTYNRIWFPLSLAYMSTLFKKAGFRTEIIDFHSQRKLDYNYLDKIGKRDFAFVTSGDIDRWLCPNIDIEPFLSIVSIVKIRTSNLYVVGPHGTLEPEKILKITGAKAVIRGEPEFKAIEVIRKGVKKTEGVSYFSGGKIVHNPNTKELDLDMLPTPDYSIMLKNKYFYEILGDNFALLEATRNCPYGCTFCNKSMYGKLYRTKPIKNIIREIKTLVKLGIKRGGFIDLDIGIVRTHLETLCRKMIDCHLGFEWSCLTRADNLDEPLIRKMALAGCRLIHIGVESNKQEIVESYNKRLNLEKVESAICLCKKYNVETLCFFIIQKKELDRKNCDYLIDYAKKINPTYISVHPLTYFRETPIYKNSNDNFFYQKDNERLKKERKRIYLKYYLRPGYIMKNLNSFRKPIEKLKFFLTYIRKC